jgi:hypothetical protein
MSDSKSVTFDLGFEAETRGPAEAALTYTHLGGREKGQPMLPNITCPLRGKGYEHTHRVPVG